MLSTERVAFDRGPDLKRYVRAAAAMNRIYDDVALAEAIGRRRNTLGKWWAGIARPDPEGLDGIARATGLSIDDLTRFVYFDGPPPTLPDANRRLTPEDEAIAAEMQREAAASPPTHRPTPRQTTGR